ncbi:hypothetical protein RU639_002440 [Aspergillus parasiticus]
MYILTWASYFASGRRLFPGSSTETQLGRQLQEIVLDLTSSLDWRGEHGYKIQATKAVVSADDQRRLQQAIINIGIEDWDEQARFLNMVLQDFNYFELRDAGLFYRAQALAALLISVGQVEKLAFGPYGEHLPGKEFGFHNYLRRMAASQVDLGIIIRSAKNLNRFTYTVGGRHEMDYTPVFTRPLLESLLAHHKTLQYLNLDVESHTSELEMFDESSIELYPKEDYKQEEYEAHWADELAELASQDFSRFKHLSIGSRVLYCYARGFGAAVTESFSLVDHLPPSLESLRIYGYGSDDGHGFYPPPDIGLDTQISKLLEEKEQKLPLLSVIEGLDAPIPNGRNTYNPGDEEEELAWHRKDDEWVEHDES